MSTANIPSDSNRYVEFDEYVEFQLEKTRKSIKSNDLLTAVAVVAAFLLTSALAFVLLDHWIIPGGFSVTARWLWSVGLGGLCLGWLVWHIGVPAFRTVNRLFAARELEHADPALRSNLLNWVDLRDAGRTVDPAVMKTIEKQAATQLAKMDVGQAVDHRRLLLSAYALLAVVIVFCAYALVSPKKISTSLWRMLPFTQAGPVTRTEIREVLPGDATLLTRGRLELDVTLAGEIPEVVQFLYSTADGRIQDEAMVLRPEAAGSTRFQGVFAGETGSGVLQNFTYRIIAGDAESARYRVIVRQPPSATVQEVAYQFPEYMQLENETTVGGHLDGWEGAVATITATADKPCRSAVLQFLHDPQSPPTGEELPVEVTDGTQLRAVWTMAFRPDGTYPKHYRIQCRSEEGEADPSPVVYNIAVKPDRPPEIVLLHPERDLTAPANGVIPLLAQASDPDFELAYINLQVEQAGQSIFRQQLSEGRQSRLTLEYDFELSGLSLKVGDEIEFWIEAYDNRQPRRNRKNTPRIKVKIEEPASPEAAQEQLAEQRRERDEKLAEANREQNGAQPDAEPMPREDSEQTNADADPKERDPQPPRAPEDSSAESEQANAGNSPSGEEGEKSNGKGNTGESGTTGQSGDGTSDSKSGDSPSEAPLSPDGDQDDEVLQKLNERLNPKRKPPPETDSKPTDGSKSTEKSRPKPTDAGEAPMTDDGTSTDADGNSESPKPEPGSEKSKPTERGQKPAPGDSTNKPDASKDPESMPPEGTEPSEAADTSTQSKPRDNSSSKTKSQPTGKPDEKSTGDKPMPGDEAGDTQPDMPDGAAESSEEDPTTKSKSATKPAAKSDTGSKPSPQKPNDNGDMPPDAGEKPSGQDADGPMPTAPNGPKEKTAPKSEQPGDKPARDRTPQGKPPEKTKTEKSNSEKSDTGDNREDMPGGDGEAGTDSTDESESKTGDKPESGGKKPASKSTKPTGTDSPEQNTDGTTESSADGEPSTEGEPTKDMDNADDGKPSPSGDKSAAKQGGSKPKSKSNSKQESQPGNSPDKPAEGDDSASDSKPDGNTPEQPGDGAEGDSPNEKPAGTEKSKTKTGRGKPTDKPGNSTEPKKTKPDADSQPNALQKTDGDPDGAEEELKGPGRPEGQKAERPDVGEGGGSKQDKEGNRGKTPGPGEKTDEAGDEMTADEETGKPDPAGRSGAGSTKRPSEQADGKNEDGETSSEKTQGKKSGKQQPGQKPGEKSDSSEGEKSDDSGKSESEGDNPGEGSEGSSKGESGKPSSKPGKAGKNPGTGMPGEEASESSNPTEGGAAKNGFAGAGGGAEETPSDPEAANLDYNRQAAELVLQRLKDDLNNDSVDPKLLDELGWTPEQLQRFTERLAKQLEKPADELSPLDEARRRQFEEMLKSLDLKQGGAKRSGDNAPQREIDQTGARRAPVPQDYKAAYENFTRNLSKRKAAESKPAPKR